ncbi:hypothetical protein COCVIDRAFT_34785 [Bipolaris victoriae FI3]|uniref:Uncharacterized protein n=1 Tax=Bipolaris victoriae (strain FI3) TaxID=930091 RepID=W7F2E9_BIPV3|nr:hypothetical protein COCVIDRAFT_34785 [Bipolaris victoriae FI3]
MQRPRGTKDCPATLQDVAGRIHVLSPPLNRVPSHLGQLWQQTCLHHVNTRVCRHINKGAERGERCRASRLSYSTCPVQTDFGIMTATCHAPRRRRHGGTMIGKSIPTASPAGCKYASSYLVYIRGLLTQNKSDQQRPTLLPHILAILVPRLLTTFEHSPHTLNSSPHQPSDSHSLPKLSMPLLLSSCTAIPCIDALRYACHPGNGRLGCCPSSVFPASISKSHRSPPDNSPSHAGNSDKEG